MLLLKKEKEREFKLFKENTSSVSRRKQNILVDLKDKELLKQQLSAEKGLVIGVLGFEKVGKSTILQTFYKDLDLIPTKRVTLTCTGYGPILIDTPPITAKSSRKHGQKEITKLIMKTCHVILLVTTGEKDKELVDHIKSCFMKCDDNFKPHVIVVLNKCKPMSDSQLDDIKKFYKKQLQSIDVVLLNNTTQPKSSRPLLLSANNPGIQKDTVNLYKLPIIDSTSTFSDQARFEVSLQQLKKDIFAIAPVDRTERWALSEQEWFKFANNVWQKIYKMSSK